MKNVAWYRGDSLKRVLQGAALGGVATLTVGFGWGGWMLGSTAKTLADSTATSNVAAATAPICVDHFQRSADDAMNLTALRKTNSWQQAAYVEKGGWVVMPGSKTASSGVPPSLRRSAQQPKIGRSASRIEDRRKVCADRPAVDEGLVTDAGPLRLQDYVLPRQQKKD